MNGTYGVSEAEAYDEAFDESDEAYDEAYDEARRGGRPMRPISVPRTGTAYQPRPSAAAASQVVTQPQLQAALQRVSQQINTNAKAIKMVDGRVRSVASEQSRTNTAVRKEITDRKQSISAVRKDLQSTREVTALLPLLTTLTGNSSLAAFAPLLLLGNDVSQEPSAAAASGTGSFLGLGGNNLTGIIALLAITGGLTAKK